MYASRSGGAKISAPFPPVAFDHVYFCSVFHWVDDKPAALAGAYHVLKPGGTIGMTTGDRDEPSTIRGITNKVLGRSPYKGQVNWYRKTPVSRSR